jgi:alkanesulfonate monooxygenase SsuD/methylene tetrahydromethanopterin reductase-like flavin-dependent oxidoreductase (luciferase family)
VIDLAGHYADHLDLAPPSHRQSSNEFQRKLLTTTADLEDAAREVRVAASAAGPAPAEITFSVLMTNVVFCAESEVASAEEAICAALDLHAHSMTVPSSSSANRNEWPRRSASARSGSGSHGWCYRATRSTASAPKSRRS